MKNCPNCGGAVNNIFCEYCGTPLYTPQEAIEKCRGKVCHIWYEDDNNNKIIFDMYIGSIVNNYEHQTFYSTNKPYYFLPVEQLIELTGSLRDIDKKKWREVVKF